MCLFFFSYIFQSDLYLNFFSDGKWQSLCNHRRAFRFFIDSITPSCRFPAFPCDSYERFLSGKCFDCGLRGCPHMGYYTDKNARGKHYLVTRETEPFCGRFVIISPLKISNHQFSKAVFRTDLPNNGLRPHSAQCCSE